ncbi:hypothetical protein LCGC14_1345450 [marine sediment metagenome]|uniref:C1q domain-containing protein n=1 Tax=marine sediment metagenome TaxID=412755 RepID=A0A0F9KYP2_9ZZZZ
MTKGGNKLAGVSLIFALAGVGVGVFSFISMNNYINDANAYVLPMARVYYDGPPYTIPSGGTYKLFNYTQKSYDTHGAFNLTSNSYTIPETGYYQVIAQYSIFTDVGEFFLISLYSNDNLVSFISHTSGLDTNTFGVALMDINNFTKGDSLTIKVYIFNLGSLSRNIFNGEEYTFFSIAKIT